MLTLAEDGRPLGDPTPVLVGEQAIRPRLAASNDGRALLAYSNDDGKLQGVPIACGLSAEGLSGLTLGPAHELGLPKER